MAVRSAIRSAIRSAVRSAIRPYATADMPIFGPSILTLVNAFGGNSAATSIRNSTGTFNAFDATSGTILKTAEIDEHRVTGAREVRNLFSYPEDFSNAAWGLQNGCTKVGTTTVAGVTAMEISFGATTTSRMLNATGITSGAKVSMFWVRAKSGSTTVRINSGATMSGDIPIDDTQWWPITYLETAANADTNFYLQNNSAGSSTNIYIMKAQAEDVTGMANQNPSEYVGGAGAGPFRKFFDLSLPHNQGRDILVNTYGWVITDGGAA